MGPLGGLQGAPSSCSGVPSTEVSFSEVRVSQEGEERGCCLQLEAPGTLTPFLPSKVNHSWSVGRQGKHDSSHMLKLWGIPFQTAGVGRDLQEGETLGSAQKTVSGREGHG